MVVDMEERDLAGVALGDHDEGVAKLDVLANVKQPYDKGHAFLGGIEPCPPELVVVSQHLRHCCD